MKTVGKIEEKRDSDFGIIDPSNVDLGREVFWFRTNNDTVWFSLNDLKKLKALVEGYNTEEL